MDECPFCAIAAGQEPAHRVLEDDETVAFLDHAPMTTGHTLVIPKTHVPTLSVADPETVSRAFQTARRVGRAVERAFDVDGYSILQSNGAVAGQEVHHLHVHVVPRFEGDGVEIGADHEPLSPDRGADVSRSLRAVVE
ncbi:HIT family hydrolase, diadenosine tetraphosphate hydrolase [Halovivax ruber XH-70]|uniref:HIT family hydrolase, diadenosine tetraphosphate hydrolase n=1 Tax=Halovivax ruber (strain DSM 18193 / JCM 13892 / XH-70) TaxID=797302 RepID=L0IEB1_HALRX|nr:HIT domain-containing protein [Halovivax ruber]AGB17114.1 HIT family hydrolase, diadenosine tetraphosphate hydrolase [Halovivax ruber XH-70]